MLCRRGGGAPGGRSGNVQIGEGGDPGLHNKPLGCDASDVYALSPACEEEEEEEDVCPSFCVDL